MIPAFLTTILFSLSAISANRSISQLGSNVANASRLLLAAFLLGVIALIAGEFPGGTVFWIFFLSGVIGFGFGDIGVFYALPRLGSRLCILFAQCLAAPIAGVIEWAWLGSELSGTQVWWAVATLLGVCVALDPLKAKGVRKDMWRSGALFGLLAAVGQGAGAVVSRYGYDIVSEEALVLPPMTAAFFRVLGGLLVAALALRLLRPRSVPGEFKKRGRWNRKTVVFIVANALAGPVLGVSCYQWALAVRPSFVVLPIVALTPVVVMPMSMIWEGDRPSVVSVVGSVFAVLSAVMLTLATLG
ncbi:Integral membrane protein DUF6 [Verrucomicrobiia bacterium DG1235]|nr:Integral membrane protein DUF6 [Verrucomicrobiae bacterium DG1235]